MKSATDIQKTLQQAMALHQAGDIARAETMYRDVLARDAKNPDAWHLLGVIALQRGDLGQSEEYIRKAIAVHDRMAAYFSNLGSVLKARDLPADAETAYCRALALDPGHFQALRGLGDMFLEQKRHEEAEAYFARALKKKADDADMWNQYGLALMHQRKLPEAVEAYKQALKIMPQHVVAMNNLADIRKIDGDYAEARALYDQALALRPDYGQAQYNRGILNLKEERLAEGWSDLAANVYSWLPQMDGRRPLPWLSVPLWNGANLKDRNMVIWGNQGIGDEILFASMAEDLMAQGAHLTIECTDRLVPIYARSFPQARVIARGVADDAMGAEMHWQAPGLWLGRYLRPDLNSFPARRAFLKADPARTAQLRARYQAYGRKRVIGIAWYSKMKGDDNSPRNASLQEMLSVLPLADALIVDLQYGNRAADRGRAQAAFPVLAMHYDEDIDQFQSLDDFAAQVAACDQVVTICNTTAHMAGALGIPACVLLPHARGLTWYWHTKVTDCPWYPTVKLLRQATDGDWSAPLRQIPGMLA